jgi:hypothetical protein
MVFQVTHLLDLVSAEEITPCVAKYDDKYNGVKNLKVLTMLVNKCLPG